MSGSEFDETRLSRVLEIHAGATRPELARRLGGANALPQHSSLDADVWSFVDRRARECIAKIYRPEARDFTFENAVLAYRQAEHLGVGPGIIAVEPELQAIIFESQGPGWRTAKASDFQNPAILQRACHLLHLWHESAVLGIPAVAVSTSMENLSCLTSNPTQALFSKWEHLQEIAFRCEAELADANASIGPVHGEIFPGNVLIGPGGNLQLLDFDHAVDGDRASDIGAMLLEMCPREDDHVALVEAYDDSKGLLERARRHAVLQDLRWGAWALRRQLDPNAPALVDYTLYARIRFSRALGNYQAWF